MNKPITIEVCVESPRGVRAAAAAGADRVELCHALSEGGLTPGPGAVLRAVETAIPVMVLIRPRRGGFVFDEDDVEVMRRDIRFAREAGARGVVIGALERSGGVCVETMRRLLEEADGLETTFHRAVDLCASWRDALDRLMELGIGRVLTSGGGATAPEGAPVLASMVAHAGDRLVVVAGGGVRPGNAAELVRSSGVSEVHFSAPVIQRAASWSGEARLATRAPLPEDEHYETDPAVVTAVRAALEG